FEPYYAAIECPVLFLPAALHPRFAKKEAFLKKFRSLLKGPSKTVVIPETRHIMVFDKFQEVSREILSFLEEEAHCPTPDD
ncbi:MAG: alpha/beta fold hydrolase, partial [Tumebacillaceae bacterium]